ncbi:MAG: type II secretion system protein [Verrucomicrobiales bacterium]
MKIHPHPFLRSWRTNLRQNRAGGFSLTELMIVIVIIVVLVLITFSLTTNMREKAKGAQCSSNLKAIGTGLLGYIAENNGRFPNGGADVSWLRDENRMSLGLCWYDAAALGMGRENYSMRFNDPKADPLPPCFGCPSGNGKPYHPAWPYTGDYAANLLLGNNNDSANPLNITAVKNPSLTPYVQDTVKQNNFGPNIFSSGFSKENNFAFAAHHNGKGNILWVDGRVSTLSYEEYMAMANDSKYGGPSNFMRGDW